MGVNIGTMSAARAKGQVVLTISQDLPAACLIGGEGAALGALLGAQSALWFCAHPDDVLIDGDAVAGWRARVGGRDLRASAGNVGGSRFDLELPAFVLRTGVHCGLTLANAAPTGTRFTAALIFAAPDDEARTLLAVNTGAANDMIFLSEAGGQIFAKDRAGALCATLPSPRRHGGLRLVIVSYTGRALHLWADGAQVVATGVAAGLNAPVDLFIGCRSNRAGLSKTLGASQIRDVMFWPNHAVLAQPGCADFAAVMRYFRWSRV